MKKLAGGFVVFALCLAANIHAVGAQTVPFGKNKIQYREFDWRILPGKHIDVYYYPEEEAVAQLALAYGEESFEHLSQRFQHYPTRRIPLIVYSSDQHFEQTNVFPGFIPEGVLGFTEYLKRRVAMPFRGDYDQFRNTLRHELVHAFQISKLSEVAAMHPRIRRASPQNIHWWTEGLAEFWSSEQTAEDEMFVRDLVVRGRLPDIRRFGYTYSFLSYPVGAELHKYLSGRFGEEYIVRMYEEYWRYDSFEQALEGILGVDIEQLNREWRFALEQKFFPNYANRPPLNVGAREVIGGNSASVKPLVYKSPRDNTTQLLFLSARTGYTSLYGTPLDRAEEGVEKLLEGERTPEFESFHAFESALDVNSEGVLALASRYMDRDALILWDIERREVVGRYQWDDLVGIKSPAWHPDGTSVVFEGLSAAGFSDLYVLDFATHQRRTLTNDRFRDEDPDWSPDGRTVVFASDRTPHGREGFTNIFEIDVETRSMRHLTLGRWHDQDPRWSNDGSRIAFTSDRAGTYDLYTVDRQGNGRQITAFTGGAFDPEWLPDDRGLVFAGFSEGTFRIYQMRLTPDTSSQPIIALGESPTKSQENGTIAAWSWGEADRIAINDSVAKTYRPLQKISLDFAGGDATFAPGLGAAQGAQFLISDMLGNHILFAGISAVQANDFSQFVDNFSGNVMYLNLTRRLNYGVGAFRFKGRFRDVAYDVYQEETFGGYFIASYPFSKFHRIELQLGAENSNRIDLEDIGGALNGSLDEDTRDLTRDGMLASNYVSYVKDNTLWVQTGPIDGERFNLTAGLVTCFACTYRSDISGNPISRSAAAESYSIIADYRRYFRTSLYSAYAIRAYGFFSDGAIPARSILGGPHRLRGYPRFSLTGSRLWLVNQEWRFPILNGLGLAFPFGEIRLPGIQGAFFGDIGSSWLESQDKPDGTWGSYGAGFRMSLGAPLVLRLDVGRRFRIGQEPPVVFGGRERFGDTFVDFFFGFNY